VCGVWACRGTCSSATSSGSMGAVWESRVQYYGENPNTIYLGSNLLCFANLTSTHLALVLKGHHMKSVNTIEYFSLILPVTPLGVDNSAGNLKGSL